MNKKFSTLVAALLVSGAGYAVVSTFNAYPLANSPIVKAATANLNVSTRSAADYSVKTLKASETDLDADNVKWNVSGTDGSYVFNTKGGSVLGKDATGIILRNSNVVVEGAKDLEFAWDANKHLTTDGGANVLAIAKADGKIELVVANKINLETHNYATLFEMSGTQTSAGAAALSTIPGLNYKIGAEVKTPKDITVSQKGVTLAESLTPVALGQTIVSEGSTDGGPDGLTVGNAAVTKATLVTSAAGNKYLKVITAKGTELFLHANEGGDVTFTSEMPGENDGIYSKISLASGQHNAIQVGINKILLFNANGHDGAIYLGTADNYSNGTTPSTPNSNDAGVFMWTDDGGKLGTLPKDNAPFYLLNITSDASAFADGVGSAKVLDLTVAAGSSKAEVISDLSSHAALDLTLTEVEGGGYYLSNGYTYFSATATAVEKAEAVVFVLDPVDGAIKVKDGGYLCADGSSSLSVQATVTSPHTKLYLYDASATQLAAKPVTLEADLSADKKYVIAQVAGFDTEALAGEIRVVVSTEDPGTPVAPDAGAKELTNGANYFITDGTNYLAYNNNGALANVTSHKDDALTEMWIATEHKGANGVPTTYSFVNRSTEAGKLAFKVEFKNNAFPDKATFDAAKGTYSQFFIDKDGKVTFTAKATDKDGKAVEQVYYLNFDGTNWSFIKDNSIVQNFTFTQTAEGFNCNAKYLNKEAGNGSDFSFLFAANAKRDSLKPLKETVLSKSIVAVDASDYTNVFKSYTSNESYAAYAITEGLFFSTSLSNDTKKTVLENFRASKFIIVDPNASSSIIGDKDANQFFNYIEVSGSDLVDEKGVLLADPTNYVATNTDIKDGKALAGVKYVFSNVIFKAQQRQGAQYSDPVYATTPSAYYNPETNEDGLAGYEAATNLAVAVKKFQGTYYVGAAKNVTETPRWEYVYIGTNNDVTYKQVYGIVNIYNAKYDSKGEVYANTATGIDKLDTKYITVNMNAPEGQFLVNYANNKFTFTNRESGKKAFEYSGNAAYGLKTVKDAKGNVIKDVYAVANGTDTVKIVLALPETIYDGYKNFDQKKYELTDSVYTMSFLPKVDGKEGLDRVYVAENHDTDHMLTLTTDNADAAKFSMVKFEAKADTVYVSTGKYITSDGKLVDDKAVAFAYTIYNDDNDEYVEYNNAVSKEYFFCNWDKKVNEEPLKQKAQRYILKEKGNNNYQLIAISYKEGDSKAFNDLKDAKAYGAFQAPKVSQEKNIYKVTDNDIINISVIGAPMYRTVEAAPFDTIRIYKEGSKNVALYAKTAEQEIVSGSNWLAMGHSADVNTAVTKFSMFVDTAYVRANTNKPQYMLVIEADTVHGKYACGVPGHDLHDSGKIDTVYGKYLTTMIDSIPAWGNKHSNPYYWEDTKYPRLGFVNAKHFGDSLVILNDNGIQHANDTINLNDNSNKFGVYAFRIVNDDTKSFNIETAYDRKADGSFTTGWIKWLNGVPVVAPNDEKDKAEIFSLEATSNDPVANETIGTSTISVVAGNGTLTIKGAAGKKVAISNVLGQAIANTVLSSDNATISAPSGIVVVAVEGEAAVKAIVK